MQAPATCRGTLVAVAIATLSLSSDISSAGNEARGDAVGRLAAQPETQAQLAADDLLLDRGSSGGELPGSRPSGTDGGPLLGDELIDEGSSKDGSLPSDDLLNTDGEAENEAAEGLEPDDGGTAYQMHEALFAVGDRYPSAKICSTCHPRQYREWSVSQHAYAQLSPIYMAMQMTFNSKYAGTNGDFCTRCHTPIGMNLGESVYASNLDRHPISREGVTCVVCHRIEKAYGKVSGRLPLAEGDLFSPVYGPRGGKELERVLRNPDQYRVVTERGEPGRAIHTEAREFFQLTKPGFCGTCHDVTYTTGLHVEEAFAEFQQSPASARGVTCQDCHMGREQGVVSGYEYGPAATVGDEPTRPRKLANHYFAGPDYPIVHPGIFPHHIEAAEFKTAREWLQFDHEAGWGTDAFEQAVPPDYDFPEAWASVDDRYDARKILDEQFRHLEWANEKRLEVLRNGFEMSEIRITRASGAALAFEVDVRSVTDGHGVPTGLDAERLVFLQVRVLDGDGNLVYVSGDRDPNGDIRDSHSLYVHDGELPLDEDLFSLQSRFLVRLERGGEREEVLSLNHSLSPQPFVRPEARATTIYGRPLGARKHKMTLPPLGKRTAVYEIGPGELTGSGPYTINVKLIAQMVPVHLVAAIQGVGFDFGMSPKEVAKRVVEGASTLYENEVTVELQDDAAQRRRVAR